MGAGGGAFPLFRIFSYPHIGAVPMIRCEGIQAWSKEADSRSAPEGVRGFKSLPSHWFSGEVSSPSGRPKIPPGHRSCSDSHRGQGIFIREKQEPMLWMTPEGSPPCLDRYPPWAVAASPAVSASPWVRGAYLMYRAWPPLAPCYLAFVLFLEIRLLRGHCVDCTYYGKVCAFGKGGVSARFFPRGDPARFSRRKISWIDILPDFLVTLVPMATGILLLIRQFDWLILILLAALFLLGFAGTGLVRTRIACRFCSQRELGCPAEQLFGKART